MRPSLIACLALTATTTTATADPQPLIAAVGHGLPAGASRIRFGGLDGGAISQLDVAIRRLPDHAHVTLTFGLATRSRDPRELALPLQLSAGVSVTGIAIDTGTGSQPGLAMDAGAARISYEETVQYLRDPALLEWQSSQRETEAYRLRVYPVSRQAPATVTVELAVPYGAPLVLDPGRIPIRRAAVVIDDTPVRGGLGARRTIALAPPDEELTTVHTEPALVDHATSLLALPEAPRSRRGVSLYGANLGLHPHVQTLPTQVELMRDRDVTAAVDAHTEQLARCFALGRAHGEIESSASLAISIAQDGSVTNVDVDDVEDDQTSNCLADEIATWTFSASRRPRTLRHALAL